MTWNTNSSLYDPTNIWGTDYTNNVSGPQINNANNQAANSGDFNFGNFMLNNPVGVTLDDFGPQNINAGPQVNDTNNGLLSIIIQQLVAIEISQLVNAYNASIVTLGDIPFIKCIIICKEIIGDKYEKIFNLFCCHYPNGCGLFSQANHTKRLCESTRRE